MLVMDLLRSLAQTLMHLSPDTMNFLAHEAGHWLYVILFLIIFAETGLVASRSCRATRCCSPSVPSPRTPTRRSTCR